MSGSPLDQPPPYPGIKSAFESSCDLVIGIDFGTTFTGVAYAHTGTAQSSSNAISIADKVVIIRAWPSASSHYAEKTPTVLSYNTSPPSWGGKVRPSDDPQVAHFKLGLQENVGGHYLKKSAPQKSALSGLFNKRVVTPAAADDLAAATANISLAEGPTVLGGYLADHNWKHPKMPHMKAVDYSADYLTRIVDHVLHESLPRQFGSSFLENQQISYVVTVPAIWTDKAKDLTRQAAVRAGIDQSKLMLITEPEAAALYCATLCKEADLKEGDRFVVCDAGGGTVVSPLNLPLPVIAFLYFLPIVAFIYFLPFVEFLYFPPFTIEMLSQGPHLLQSPPTNPLQHRRMLSRHRRSVCLSLPGPKL